MRQKEAEFSYLILTKRLFCEFFVPPVIALYGSNTPAGIRRANCLPGGEPITRDRRPCGAFATAARSDSRRNPATVATPNLNVTMRRAPSRFEFFTLRNGIMAASDPHPTDRRKPLATCGRTIHQGQKEKFQCAFSVRPIRKPRSLRLLSVVPRRRLVQREVVWRGGRLSSAERATTQERLIARCGFYALGGHELILLRGPSLFPRRPLSRIVTILNLHTHSHAG